MIIHWLTLLISLLFVNVNKAQNLAIAVTEHKPNDIIANDSSWKTAFEKILIRVPRMNEKLPSNNRQRRQFVDTDEILGMAKKVAITVFVLLSLCILCSTITTIVICVKCCCSGNNNNNRKRNQDFHTVPQPIIIHTTSPNYQPQFQQQASPAPQIWYRENSPMLPQPSAPPQPNADLYRERPPQPNDDFYTERPPPYEKICGN